MPHTDSEARFRDQSLSFASQSGKTLRSRLDATAFAQAFPFRSPTPTCVLRYVVFRRFEPASRAEPSFPAHPSMRIRGAFGTASPRPGTLPAAVPGSSGRLGRTRAGARPGASFAASAFPNNRLPDKIPLHCNDLRSKSDTKGRSAKTPKAFLLVKSTYRFSSPVRIGLRKAFVPARR